MARGLTTLALLHTDESRTRRTKTIILRRNGFLWAQGGDNDTILFLFGFAVMAFVFDCLGVISRSLDRVLHSEGLLHSLLSLDSRGFDHHPKSVVWSTMGSRVRKVGLGQPIRNLQSGAYIWNFSRVTLNPVPSLSHEDFH
jgi:hypothetical protein